MGRQAGSLPQIHFGKEGPSEKGGETMNTSRREVPIYKGYCVDFDERKFRKYVYEVWTEVVDFDSEPGKQLLMELAAEQALRSQNPENPIWLYPIDLAERLVKHSFRLVDRSVTAVVNYLMR
jgi:hypothetical protein